jgi:AcrR family transcriptional regulator
VSRQPEARARLLRSATNLLAGRGIAGTSMRAVAEDAGVNVQLIYHYYGSKPELILATVQAALARSSADLDRAEAAPDPAAALRLLVGAYSIRDEERLVAQRVVAEAIAAGDAAVLPAISTAISGTARRLGDIVRAGITRGIFRTDVDVPMTVTSLVGLPLWYAASWPLVSQLVSSASPERLERHLETLLVDAILARDPVDGRP